MGRVVDVGKDAKRAGKLGVREARALAHPERELLVHRPGEHEVEKRWGYVYEYRVRWWDPENSKWVSETRWFESEKSRDQSLHVVERRMAKWDWYRNPKKVQK